MNEFSINGYSCRAESFGGDTLVLLFSGFDRQIFSEVSGLLRDSCRKLTLAEFGEIDWDRDYSPWEAEGTAGRKFAGGADRLVSFLPEFTRELERLYGDFSGVYLCGYSLGGLFSLYASVMWKEQRLLGAASCSGSMWYPGWVDFLKEHPLHGRIYLSLGGKEKNSPDPLMASVEVKTAEVKKIAGRTSTVIFRNEPGGHFSRVSQRIARAVTELLDA